MDQEYPMDPVLLLDGKAKGLNKMNAGDVLEKNLPVCDHNPLLQSVMSQKASTYRPACWVQGVCRQHKIRKLQQTLHRTMMRGIKEQIGSRGIVPSEMVKDYLVSGDLVVAFRFPASTAASSQSHPSPSSELSSVSATCRLFSVPKVILRPEGAVLVAMEVVHGVPNQARLSENESTGLNFRSSLEWCAELLNEYSPGWPVAKTRAENDPSKEDDDSESDDLGPEDPLDWLHQDEKEAGATYFIHLATLRSFNCIMMLEDELKDPLHAVAESVQSDIGRDDFQQPAGSRARPKSKASATPMVVTLDPSIGLRVSAEGLRKMLHRPPNGRPKPLLKLTCKGCRLSTHDADPFVEEDWLECPGWGKVCGLLAVTQVLVTHGDNFNRCCYDASRRAFPKMKRDDFLNALENDPALAAEFKESRLLYLDDVKEMLENGNMRIKKRNRRVKNDDVNGITNKLKGTFMALEKSLDRRARMGWGIEQLALADRFAADSLNTAMSLEDARKKVAADAKRKAMEEEANDAEEEPKGGKRIKTENEGKGEEDEDVDMDEQEEVLYIQAVKERQDEEEEDLSQGEDMQVANEVMMRNSPAEGGFGLRNWSSSRGSSSKEASVKDSKNAKPPATKLLQPIAAKESLAVLGEGSPQSNRRRVGGGAASICGRSAVAVAPVGLVPDAGSAAPVDHACAKSWELCRTVASLQLSAEGGGQIFAPPAMDAGANPKAKAKTKAKAKAAAAATSGANSAVNKWLVEVAKQKPFLMIVENMFSNDPSCKVTEQQVKGALTQAKKCKVDKKIGYETVNANGDLTFTTRMGHLISALATARDLRGAANASAKSSQVDVAALQEYVKKLQEEFQALVPGFMVALPLLWVQAWVGARLQMILSDDVVIDDKGVARVCSQCLYLKENVVTKGECLDLPSESTYGTMMDFFYFCPDSLQDEKIIKLQNKYLGKLILKAFSAKLPVEEAFAVITACLPEERGVALTRDGFQSMILSRDLAKGLWIIFLMVTGQADTAVMQEAQSVLASGEFIACHRPLARLVSMSQYKRVVHECYEAISLQEMDTAANAKAKELNVEAKDLEGLRAKLEGKDAQGLLKFSEVFDAMKQVVAFKVNTSSLPCNEHSDHWELREKLLHQDLLPMLEACLSSRFVSFMNSLEEPLFGEKAVKALDDHGLRSFRDEVKKGDESGPGKHGNREVLGYCPFSLKSLAIYLSDIVDWVLVDHTLTSVEGGCAPPFADELKLIDLAENVLDSHKCCDAEDTKKIFQEVFEAARSKSHCEHTLGKNFDKAFKSMVELIGHGRTFTDRIMPYSLEKLVAEFSDMKTLGACFKDLVMQTNLVKTAAETEANQQMLKLATQTTETAKIALACQSGAGSIIAVQKNQRQKVLEFKKKIQDYELSFELLPLSLQDAVTVMISESDPETMQPPPAEPDIAQKLKDGQGQGEK
eukprot:Skav201165  [mRNA]  locus=scaffold65:492536:505623:- [translate_table: standard]